MTYFYPCFCSIRARLKIREAKCSTFPMILLGIRFSLLLLEVEKDAGFYTQMLLGVLSCFCCLLFSSLPFVVLLACSIYTLNTAADRNAAIYLRCFVQDQIAMFCVSDDEST